MVWMGWGAPFFFLVHSFFATHHFLFLFIWLGWWLGGLEILLGVGCRKFGWGKRHGDFFFETVLNL